MKANSGPFFRALSQTTERDFEVASLVYYRIFNSGFRQSPARQTLDKAGIDLYVRGSAGRFRWVVQCKSVSVGALDDPINIDAARKSIHDFRDSGNRTHYYVLQVNRSSKDSRNLHQVIQGDLDELVTRGCAVETMFWTPRDLADKVHVRAKTQIFKDVQRRAKDLRDENQKAFALHADPLVYVPVARKIVRLKRDCPISVVREDPSGPIYTKQLIGRDQRLTIISGMFGCGKTTSVLEFAQARRRDTLIIPCRELPLSIPNARSFYGFICSEILGLTPVSDASSENTFYEHVYADAMERALATPDTGLLIVFDAIDENRFLSTPEGFTILCNLIKGSRAHVVITSRAELLEGLLGRFEVPLSNLASGTAASVPQATILELQPWSLTQQVQYIRSLSKIKERDAIESLFTCGEMQATFGDIITNPLLLSYTAEEVSENGIRDLSRPEIIFSHIERKVRRDCLSSRISTTRSDTVEEKVLFVLLSMALISCTMTERRHAKLEMTEWTSESVIQKVIQRTGSRDGRMQLSGIDLAVNSFLIPRKPHRFSETRFFFSHRALQEYFLALGILVSEIDGTPPPEVQSLVDEMRLVTTSNPDADFTYAFHTLQNMIKRMATT